MKKLTDLRTFLLDHPIGIEAENLLTFAEKGETEYNFDPDDKSFQISYDANLVLTDFVGDFNAVLFVLQDWLYHNQPDLKPDAVKFHIDILDHRRSDVSLLVSLSEDIQATEQDTGHELTSLDEPNIYNIGMPYTPEEESEQSD
jgi:hypothetical protein